MDLSTERSSSIVRWTLCGIGSVALHFALLSGTRSPSAGRTSFGESASSIEVQLAMAPKAEIRATESTAQWQPLPRWSADRPRFAPFPALLPFRGIDRELDSIDEKAYLPVSRLTIRPTPVKGIFVPYFANNAFCYFFQQRRWHVHPFFNNVIQFLVIQHIF